MNAADRFDEYLEHLAAGLGHADRHDGLRGYCTGLMLPLTRKSVEPMAARVDPVHASARHQSLHHFVAKAEWSDEQMLRRVCQWVVPKMDFSEGGWWIIDDTGFPKKGRHSVGVARQYCGVLGKQDTREHSYWNLRVIEFNAGEDSYSAVHEVYYEADGRLRGYSVDPAIMMWLPDDEPGAAQRALEKFQRALAEPPIKAKEFG